MKTVDPEQIKTLIRNELLKDKKGISIEENTSLEDLNLDSFALLSIASEIEDKYNIWLIQNAKQIEEMKISMKTFGEFIEFLNKKINDESNSKSK
jgi:acyl carrier protein